MGTLYLVLFPPPFLVSQSVCLFMAHIFGFSLNCWFGVLICAWGERVTLWLIASNSWFLVDGMFIDATLTIALTGQWAEIIATKVVFSWSDLSFMKSNSPCARTFGVWRICAQGQQPHWLRIHPEPNFEPGAMQHMIQKRVIDSLFHLADWVFFPGSPTPAPTCPKCSKCWSLPLSFLQQHALARYP